LDQNGCTSGRPADDAARPATSASSFLSLHLNFLDRTNVSVAALQMNEELKFGPAVFDFGAGILFAGYSLLEVPSNLILAREGARRWIARIMITWAPVSRARERRRIRWVAGMGLRQSPCFKERRPVPV
jgi:hypothetical protein